MKAKIFIGSSSEKLDVAYATQKNLERHFEVTVWTQGIVRLSEPVIDSLITSLNSADYAIFVFTPDDLSKIREEEEKSVRDNVIFELGLFVGRLGKKRSFVLMPRDIQDFHLPTDLVGFTAASYDASREDNNLEAALGSACNEIRNAISSLEAETTTRWHTEWRLGPSKKLYREELILTQSHRNLIIGTRTTTDPEGRSIMYRVSGYNRGGFYWLEYHTENCTGGGTILLRDLTGQKLVGLVVSANCETGNMRTIGNQWIQGNADHSYDPEWQVYLGEFRSP